MAVHCAACGEELLGAVNRCWRCGRTFRHAPTPESEPPIRRPALASLTIATESSASPPPATHSSARPQDLATGILLADAAPAAVTAMAVLADASPQTPADSPQTLAEPPRGRLSRVDLSTAVHLGSPFQDAHRIRWRDRCRIWFRVPREWYADAFPHGVWARLTRRMSRRTDPAAPDGKSPANSADRSPPERTKTKTAAAISPVRSAMANASLVFACLLGIIAWLLLHYPLISIVIAGMGLSLAIASLAAQVRWRVLAPVFICLLPLANLAMNEFRAWRAAQAQLQADLWEE